MQFQVIFTSVLILAFIQVLIKSFAMFFFSFLNDANKLSYFEFA